MTPAILQIEHHLRQTFVRDFVSLLFLPRLRDLVVLAVDAAKIAVPEEDVSRAACSGKTRLFTEVRSIGRDDRETSGIARGDLVLQTVVPAVFRTDVARAQHRLESLHAL
jgi:hypothetical protein